MAADLILIIRAKDLASGVLSGVDKQAGGLGKTFGALGKAAAVGAGAGLVALGGILATSVKEAMESQKVLGQLDAVLASTGGAAGLARKQLVDMASAFQRTTTFSDEAVLGAENLLLTFTKIKGPQFEGATQAVLDMSTALGQDLQSSAIQVGKALNDPINGMTALRRVGVSFTEDQIKQVKAMVAAGDTMGAQKLILQELNTEFGGSAAKAADTFGGRMARLKNAVGEVQERIGMALLPVLTNLAVWFSDALPKIEAFVDKGILFVSDVARDLGPIFKRNVLPVLKEVVGFLKSDALPHIKEFGQVALKMGRDIAAFLAPSLDTLADLWRNALQPALEAVAPIAEKVGRFMLEHKEILIALAGAILLITNPWLAVIAVLLVVLAKWDEISTLFTKTIPDAIDSFIKKVEEIPVIGEIFRLTMENARVIVETVFGLIKNRVQFFMDAIRAIIKIVTGLIHGDWGMAWQGVKDLFTAWWTLIRSDIETAFGGIAGLVKNAMGAVGGVVGDIWNGVKGTIQGALNWIIDRINEFAQSLNKVLAPLGGLLGKVGVNIPTIPTIGHVGGSDWQGNWGALRQAGLQHGGIVPPGVVMPAILHGGARGEAIIPLDRVSRGGGGGDIHLTINSRFPPDRRLLRSEAMALLPELERLLRR